MYLMVNIYFWISIYSFVDYALLLFHKSVP